MANIITTPQLKLIYGDVPYISTLRKQLEALGIIKVVRKGAQTFYLNDELPDSVESLEDAYLRHFYRYTLPDSYDDAIAYVLDCANTYNYEIINTPYARKMKVISAMLFTVANDLPLLPNAITDYMQIPEYRPLFNFVLRPTHDPILLHHCGRRMKLENAYSILLFISNRIDYISTELDIECYVGQAIRHAISPLQELNLPYLFAQRKK